MCSRRGAAVAVGVGPTIAVETEMSVADDLRAAGTIGRRGGDLPDSGELK